MRAGGERRDAIKQVAGPGDDFGAADGVVATAACRAIGLGNDVGAVERVIEAAPAGIGGIERIARIGDRHDQLRSGDFGDFRIDLRRRHGEGRRLRLEIADALEKGDIGFLVDRLRLVVAMPEIDFSLQGVAMIEQSAVARRQVAQQCGKAGPRSFPTRHRFPAKPPH